MHSQKTPPYSVVGRVPTWNVELRGPMTSDVESALDRAGMAPTGLSRSLRGSESRCVRVAAATAAEAVRRTQAATVGSAVTVKKAVGPISLHR